MVKGVGTAKAEIPWPVLGFPLLRLSCTLLFFGIAMFLMWGFGENEPRCPAVGSNCYRCGLVVSRKALAHLSSGWPSQAPALDPWSRESVIADGRGVALSYATRASHFLDPRRQRVCVYSSDPSDP